jgi:AmiR/NasT family two-component response regulator
MDVKMPRMDGIEAAGIICDENIAPVVMLTAFSQSDLVKKATGAGAMAYVTKPYEESKLLPALEVAMGRFAEINDLLDNVERSESKLQETEEQLKKAEEQLKKAEETLEERKLVDRAKGLLMDKADFSEQGAFRWIQKTSMDQRIPKKRLAMAIIAKYGENTATRYLLPIITNPYSDERTQYRNAICRINVALKEVAGLAGLNIPLTMHVARHCWASVAKSKNIPLSVISEGMGHDSEETTRIYLASLDTSVVDKANSLILKDF